MKNLKRTFLIFCTLFLWGTIFTISLFAQEGNILIDNMPRIVGVGVGLIPDYEGSDDYTFGVAPFARLQFKGRQQYIMLNAYELQVNVLNHPWLRLGPSLNYHFGRDNVDDDVVDRMEEIDGTVEGGGFVGIELIDSTNPRKRFIANIDVLTDLGGEHDGYTVSLNARFWYPVAKPIDIGLGGSIVYASGGYMSTYFGVNPTDALRSGLPMFDADAGFKDFRINPVIVYHVNENWHIATGFQYRRLLNDAEDSPVVDMRGSANQWIVGLGLAYSW